MIEVPGLPFAIARVFYNKEDERMDKLRRVAADDWLYDDDIVIYKGVRTRVGDIPGISSLTYAEKARVLEGCVFAEPERENTPCGGQ